MQATTNIFIDKYHPRKDSKCAISIKVTYKRKPRYYPTKYKLTVEEFSKLFTEKPRHPYKEILQDLVAEEAKAKAIISGLKDQFTFSLFERKFCRKTGDHENVFAVLQDRAKQLEKEERISTSVMSQYALNSLKKFYSKERLGFDEIDVEFLKKYKNWMENQGNSITTLGMYLRELRTIFNEAVDDGIISSELYPFGKSKNKFTIPTGKNIKKALKLEDVSKIFNYKPENKSEEKARDFWVLSYLSNGANIKDLLLLKNKNRDGRFIRFVRSKTKRTTESEPIIISIAVTSDVQRIIDKWGAKSLNPDDYIFPILPKGASAKERYRLIQLFTAFLNDNMERIRKKIGVESKIKSYSARHSFSTILKRSGKSVEQISEMLGHKSIHTTKAYLASFEDEAQFETVAELTNFNKLKAV